MKTLAALLIAAATVALSQTQAPQPADARTQRADRVTAIRKLQTDLDQAISRANLNDAQRQELTTARETLRKQAEGRRKGDKLDRGTVREAMQTIRELAASNAFQAEDRETIKKDLVEMRKHCQGGKRKAAA